MRASASVRAREGLSLQGPLPPRARVLLPFPHPDPASATTLLPAALGHSLWQKEALLHMVVKRRVPSALFPWLSVTPHLRLCVLILSWVRRKAVGVISH